MQGTVAEYNAGVEAGEDPLGKPLGKDVKPLSVAPYYATRLWPKVHHCMGGVQINEHAQVRCCPPLQYSLRCQFRVIVLLPGGTKSKTL